MSDEWELVATPYSEIPMAPELVLVKASDITPRADKIGLQGWQARKAMREVLHHYDMELLPDGRSTASVLWLALHRAERALGVRDE